MKTLNKYIILLLITVCYSFIATAQYYDFGFKRSDSIIVMKQSGLQYSNPWIGGLNNCQFFEIDLDLNGDKDLIVFDKHGNKIIPFLKFNNCGFQAFVFAPEYRDVLPNFTSWVNSADYDLDDKNDIFTSTLGGIKVYKNISEETFLLKEVKPRLTTDFGSGAPINLFANEADYPGFADINGDGALDIVNFWALGKYVEYHENTGVKLYFSNDSLTYRVNTSCWGHFEENESSNVLQLNSNCSSKDIVPLNQRHSGSTMLLLDLNGDGIKDIVIGDVDYPHLISLINGGTADTANMIAQDTLFPNPTNPVRLYSMPAAASIDVDFDNIPDLLVSPFDPSRDKSENQKSIWLYKNIGTRANPSYSFVKSNFLQDQMIDLGSGAYPTFVDVDGNGLLDLVVGNWGTYDSSNYIGSFLHSYYSSFITLFLNIGTASNPQFQQVESNWGQLRLLNRKGFFPTLGDIDGDGDMDMIVGDETGKLIFLENQAGANLLPVFSTPILNYQNISVNSFSAPQLFDINKDGKLDLIIGDSLGKLHYYRNSGTSTNPSFTLVTDTLGGVNVRNSSVSYYGYSTPCFFVKNDTTYLSVGSESGFIFTYKNIDNNLNGSFQLIDDSTYFVRNNNPVSIYEGVRSGVSIADLNNDNYPDLVLGNFSGGLTYYQGTAKPSINIHVNEISATQAPQIVIVPNPATDFIRVLFKNNDSSEPIYNVSVYNCFMKLVLSIQSSQDNKINISALDPGVYFLQITTMNQSTHLAKLIKY